MRTLRAAPMDDSPGLDWAMVVRVWTGAIVMSSVAGLLLSYLLVPPTEQERTPVN